MNDNNCGRTKDYIIGLLSILLLVAVAVIFKGPCGQQAAPVDVVVAQAAPEVVIPELPVAEKPKQSFIKRKIADIKTAGSSLMNVVTPQSEPEPAPVAVAAPVIAVSPPPQAVTNLATKTMSEGGLWCPAPAGCPCGADCVYTDTNPPLIVKQQEGSWMLKSSGVMDYKGKVTPTTSIYKWTNGNLQAMNSEFQAVE